MSTSKHDAVDKLLAQIHAIRFIDYPRMLTLAEEALALAREANYTRGIARSLNAMGWACIRLWQNARAVPLAREALALAQANGWLEEEAYALLVLDSCLALAGQSNQAFEACTRILEIGQAIGSSELVIMALGDMGVIHDERGDGDSAIENYTRSIALAEESGDEVLLVFPLANMAAYFLKVGQTDEAVPLIRRGLEIATRLNFAAGRDFCAYLLSETYLGMGNAAAADLVSSEPTFPTPLREQLRARLEIHRGQHAEAVKRLRHLTETLPEDTDIPLMIGLYNDLVGLYKAQGNFERALQASETRERLHITWYQTQLNNRTELATALFEVERLERELDERRRQEAANLERQHTLLVQRQQQELIDIKRQVLARLAHDFRTPLSVLRMSFDMLTRYSDRLPPDQRVQRLERIDDQFRALDRLFNNALNVLRALEDRIIPDATEFSLASLRDWIFVPEAHASRVILEVADSDQGVRSDRVIIREMLHQLLDNALRYSTGLVTIRLSADADALTLEVEDRGPGIPANQLEHIFEPISGAHDPTKLNGVGLGLSLVHQYAHLLGGELHLRTGADTGTTARVTLPHFKPAMVVLEPSVQMA
ncbi:MAG: tetratricopeptide repeat protein [Anaerolineae bacterium]|nr:tetratricopeptide repeat protein [Anaerolineae bacterium]